MADDVLSKAMGVDSRNQVGVGTSCRVENENGKGLRVLFVGNSITLHGKLPSIGWFGDHGMAASDQAHDYVHLLEKHIVARSPDAVFCICNVANWERDYRQPVDTFGYGYAAAFDADVIVCKVGANTPRDGFDEAVWERGFTDLLALFNPAGKARVIIASEFYHHPANAVMQRYAAARGLPFIPLDDLSDVPEMKAIGQYAHEGIQNHPSDQGMAAMAARLAPYL